jgi:hypothetical protein
LENAWIGKVQHSEHILKRKNDKVILILKYYGKILNSISNLLPFTGRMRFRGETLEA